MSEVPTLTHTGNTADGVIRVEFRLDPKWALTRIGRPINQNVDYDPNLPTDDRVNGGA